MLEVKKISERAFQCFIDLKRHAHTHACAHTHTA